MALLFPITSSPTAPKVYTETVNSVSSSTTTVVSILNSTLNKKIKLVGVLVSAFVPFKAEIKTVLSNIDSDAKVVWHSKIGEWNFISPDPAFISISPTENYGQNGFKVTVTNLGIDTSDISVTIFYDEE